MFSKEHIKRVMVRDRSDDWFVLRTIGTEFHPGGIGGSEIASVLNLSQWLGLNELFYIKIGAHNPKRFLNPAMQRGITMEPHLRKYWTYYRGDDQWAEDMNSNNVLPYRKNRLVKYPVYNKKYPFLLMNLDAVIPRGERKFLSEDRVLHDCPLEIKTANSFVKRKYETGVPPGYYVQIQAQMIVMEADYGELFFESDGQLSLYPIQKNEAIQKVIIDRCKEFWDKVLLGRELMKELEQQAYGSEKYQKISNRISNLAPPIAPISAEEEFIKESWRMEQVSIACDERLNDDYYMYNSLKHLEKIAAELQQGYKNNMLGYLKDNQVAQAIISTDKSFGIQTRKYKEKEVKILYSKGANKLNQDQKDLILSKSLALIEGIKSLLIN